MKALFAHDNKFVNYKGKYYSMGGFSSNVWNRYTKVFENLVVVSRQIKSDEMIENLDLSSHKNVEFIKVPDIHSRNTINNYSDAVKVIEKEVLMADFIIARLPSSIGLLALESAKKFNKPYLIEAVGCAWDSYWNHSISGKIIAPYMFLKMKKEIKKSEHVVYVTSEFLQNRYPTEGKSTNVSNVLLNKPDNHILNRRLKKIEDKNTDDKFIIGTTASVEVRYKGQEFVIQALANLKKDGYDNFEYQMVGSGNTNYLKNLALKHNIGDNIKFLGSLSHEKVFDWLEDIDLYVQPSKQEGLPRALIEAMSYGVPSLGAKTAGIPELLEDSFIFEHNRKTIKSISEMILSMNKMTLQNQAVRNFNESKKYDVNILEERRKGFFEEFKQSNLNSSSSKQIRG